MNVRNKMFTIIIQNGSDYINIHREWYNYQVVSRHHKFLYNKRKYIVIKPPKRDFMKDYFEEPMTEVMKNYLYKCAFKFDRWISNNHELVIDINIDNFIRCLFKKGLCL